MFKITIKSQKEGQFWLEKQTQTEVDEYLAWAEESKHWGSPQWIEEIPEVLEVKDENGIVIQKAIAEQKIEHAAEYSVEVVDLSQDQDYLLEQCHQMRKAEYPPMEDYLDAVVKGDEVQKAEYIAKCQAVKAKYPKP